MNFGHTEIHIARVNCDLTMEEYAGLLMEYDPAASSKPSRCTRARPHLLCTSPPVCQRLLPTARYRNNSHRNNFLVHSPNPTPLARATAWETTTPGTGLFK
jgi:hypothetical protein